MIQYNVAKNRSRVISGHDKNRYSSYLELVRVESIVPGMGGGGSSPLMCDYRQASGRKDFDVYRQRGTQ